MTGELIHAARSALIIVDIQEKLAPAMQAGEDAIACAATLVRAARAIDVPVLASVQYPKGLGPLVPALAALIPPPEQVEKTHFSALAEPLFAGRFRALGRAQAVVAGMEAHVCVLQTAMDLLAQRFQVFVVADAVQSRSEVSRTAALARLSRAGAAIVTTEMVVFEWLERADRPEFRPLSALIR
jgi:nicotinamidase-related amidase